MKIAIITWWYAEGMGYSENCLPLAFANLGHEVHLISSDLQPDFPNYKEAYEPFIGPQQQPTGVTESNGFTLHRLPHRRTRFGIYIHNLYECLEKLNPDVIQCFGIPQRSTYQAAWFALRKNKPLFLEEHTHLSTIRAPASWQHWLNDFIVKHFLGPFVAVNSKKCYAIAADVEAVTLKYFGYPQEKLTVQSLGVDTGIFHPILNSSDALERDRLRHLLGIQEEELVFVYSGRFSQDKSPQLLAQAVAKLRSEGHPMRGLFIGSGNKEDVDAIAKMAGCIVLPFMQMKELGAYYRLADVGVWPKQESTSQLDALACGIPLIVSNRVQAKERIDGCSLTYVENDYLSLANAMLNLLSRETRVEMGQVGEKRVKEKFSWMSIAESRTLDYKAVV